MKSNVELLTRIFLIVSKLQKSDYVPSDVLLAALAHSNAAGGDSFPAARASQMRILQRAISDAEKLFGMHIAHKRDAGYYIEDKYYSDFDFDRFAADFHLLTAMMPDMDLHQYVLPERSRYTGSDNFLPLLHAIKQGRKVEFSYENVRKGTVREHTVAPYFLKEDQMRWYLVAENGGGRLTTFAINNIRGLNVLDEGFKRDSGIDGSSLFKHSYGIWDDAETPVETVVLKYDRLDGSFLKSVPLHPSQEIIVDNDDEFRISLKIKITNDFVMALLARSRSLEVIAPLHLRERIYKIYEQAITRNKR